MTRQAIIERTINIIYQLPEDRAEEISNFAAFVVKQYEENTLTKGIEKLSSESHSLDFLNEEEDLYTLADLKKVYNG